nr:intraflagellar transport protein 74 [Hymenolepis microstoma]
MERGEIRDVTGSESSCNLRAFSPPESQHAKCEEIEEKTNRMKQVNTTSREDRSYYIGMLGEGINAILVDFNTIIADYSNAEEEVRSFGHYEKMSKNLAAELRNLQGELGDYNIS